MSGGQKQRVAAARSLISDPDIILADEPTGALDTKSARLLMEKLQEINLRRGRTILMVTHDPNAASFCSRILFIYATACVRVLCGLSFHSRFEITTSSVPLSAAC